VDRRNDWNLAAEDKRMEVCGYQIDGGRIGSICYNGGGEGHSLQVLRQFRALTIAISRTSSSGSNE
jgi:hypothetical protein